MLTLKNEIKIELLEDELEETNEQIINYVKNRENLEKQLLRLDLTIKAERAKSEILQTMIYNLRKPPPSAG